MQLPVLHRLQFSSGRDVVESEPHRCSTKVYGGRWILSSQPGSVRLLEIARPSPPPIAA